MAIIHYFMQASRRTLSKIQFLIEKLLFRHIESNTSKITLIMSSANSVVHNWYWNMNKWQIYLCPIHPLQILYKC